MLKTLEVAKIAISSNAEWNDVARVCLRIPPLWDLKNYVAVNPFLGFTSEPVDRAAQTISDGLGASLLPETPFYRSCWDAGDFDKNDLAAAANRWGLVSEELEAILQGRSPMPLRGSEPILTFAERHDQKYGSDWNSVVLNAAARWCAVHASNGGSYWKLNQGDGLFGSWREAAANDLSVDIAGLRGFRSWVGESPESASEAVSEMLGRLEVKPSDRESYLYRLLGGLYGWASYYRRLTWEADPQDPGLVADLLAIRICIDAGVHFLAPRSGRKVVSPAIKAVEDESVRLVFQEALEDGFIRGLLGKLNGPPEPSTTSRPAVQAAFCIDVRSEPLRRHLEAESPEIETRGFAGFFGVALNWKSEGGESARCPVLLKPRFDLEPIDPASKGVLSPMLRHMQGAPAASFSFVELLGLAYGARLLRDSLGIGTAEVSKEVTDRFTLETDLSGLGISTEARVDLAAGILKNMGFRKTFARLVLFCGHEGQSANNPHAAGLDCGACGGHGGAINARVAAAILNDPFVRENLPLRGWQVPEDTHFLPAVHDTSVDEVRCLDVDRVPEGHLGDLSRLKVWLECAAAGVRKERAPSLGLANASPSLLDRLLRRRARDWSEVRPEWALARNAAFIAARRSRTREANLEGRTFLHEYDAEADPDDSILGLILAAPMVVASWINLQYFASTVDNGIFGAGNKALHNRVGALGVILGNGGDLRTGLALQSVHAENGSWFHVPLRLQVVVEAPREKIDRVLLAQPGVRELVENGWVRLFALASDSSEALRYRPGRGWESVDARSIEVQESYGEWTAGGLSPQGRREFVHAADRLDLPK